MWKTCRLCLCFTLLALVTNFAMFFCSDKAANTGKEVQVLAMDQFKVEKLPPHYKIEYTGNMYAGLIPLDGAIEGTSENGHYFFWFLESQSANPQNDPVLVWTNGGPGCSSSIGLLYELGPFLFDENGDGDNDTFVLNDYSWNKHTNLLIVDHPVHTGYSYAAPHVYAQSEKDVGRDFYAFLRNWRAIFAPFADLPLYLAGESYAGMYIPAIAYAIDQENLVRPRSERIPLRGFLIGNGAIDDLVQTASYISFGYYSGLIDRAARDVIEANWQKCMVDIYAELAAEGAGTGGAVDGEGGMAPDLGSERSLKKASTSTSTKSTSSSSGSGRSSTDDGNRMAEKTIRGQPTTRVTRATVDKCGIIDQVVAAAGYPNYYDTRLFRPYRSMDGPSPGIETFFNDPDVKRLLHITTPVPVPAPALPQQPQPQPQQQPPPQSQHHQPRQQAPPSPNMARNYSMCSQDVHDHLLQDRPVSMVPVLAYLVEKYKVLLFNGRDDLICNFMGTENFLDRMDWGGQTEWLNSPRYLWTVKPPPPTLTPTTPPATPKAPQAAPPGAAAAGAAVGAAAGTTSASAAPVSPPALLVDKGVWNRGQTHTTATTTTTTIGPDPGQRLGFVSTPTFTPVSTSTSVSKSKSKSALTSMSMPAPTALYYREYRDKLGRSSPASPEVAGYHRGHGNLHFLIVLNSGHMVPHDQPRRSLDMLTRFINDYSFSDERIAYPPMAAGAEPYYASSKPGTKITSNLLPSVAYSAAVAAETLQLGSGTYGTYPSGLNPGASSSKNNNNNNNNNNAAAAAGSGGSGSKEKEEKGRRDVGVAVWASICGFLGGCFVTVVVLFALQLSCSNTTSASASSTAASYGKFGPSWAPCTIGPPTPTPTPSMRTRNHHRASAVAVAAAAALGGPEGRSNSEEGGGGGGPGGGGGGTSGGASNGSGRVCGSTEDTIASLPLQTGNSTPPTPPPSHNHPHLHNHSHNHNNPHAPSSSSPFAPPQVPVGGSHYRHLPSRGRRRGRRERDWDGVGIAVGMGGSGNGTGNGNGNGSGSMDGSGSGAQGLGLHRVNRSADGPSAINATSNYNIPHSNKPNSSSSSMYNHRNHNPIQPHPHPHPQQQPSRQGKRANANATDRTSLLSNFIGPSDGDDGDDGGDGEGEGEGGGTPEPSSVSRWFSSFLRPSSTGGSSGGSSSSRESPSSLSHCAKGDRDAYGSCGAQEGKESHHHNDGTGNGGSGNDSDNKMTANSRRSGSIGGSSSGGSVKGSGGGEGMV